MVVKHKTEIHKLESKIPSSVLNDLKGIQHNGNDENKIIAQVSRILMDDRFKRRKTILKNMDDILDLAYLDSLAQAYDVDYLKIYVDALTEYLTSGNDGQGRKDIVDIAKFMGLFEHSKIKGDLIDILRQ